MKLINAEIAQELFGYEVGRSIMAFAYRTSNNKVMKVLKSRKRFDPIAHYDVEEILANMATSVNNGRGCAWKDNYTLVSSSLEGIEDEAVLKV